tara:strand:- start:44030 stop:45367 length:1338 start_codon:yes stop_codon:yes gene_type:complete
VNQKQIHELPSNIKLGNKKLSIYGIGFVGTAIASTWLRAGASIIAVDKKSKLVNEINNKKTTNSEPKAKEAFLEGINNKKLIATSNGKWASKNSDIKIISVPVGLDKRTADLRFLYEVVDDIITGLKKDDIIIVTPTVPIGTSTKIIKLIENKTRLSVEKDFFFIYNPERISAGQAISDIENNYPPILSGSGKTSIKIANKMFGIISSKKPIIMSCTEAAEAEKLIEGLYRDVNIALANELSVFCEKLGIDFWEIRDAANSQPYSQLHKPGIGVGGYCIPVYPWLLTQTAIDKGINVNFPLLGRYTNEKMPEYSVNRIMSKIGKKKNITALILGLSFRGNVADNRISPTYDVVKELMKKKVKIRVHDPFFDYDPLLPKQVKLSCELDKVISGVDVIIISTDHNEYKEIDEEYIIKKSKKKPMIFDGRNILNQDDFKKLKILTIGK